MCQNYHGMIILLLMLLWCTLNELSKFNDLNSCCGINYQL